MKNFFFKIYFFLVLSFTSINIFSQSCTITSKANDILPDNLCAPVDVSWEITYRGVDDNGTWNIEVVIDWDDGNTETVTATNTNPSTHEYKVTVTHTYPVGGNRCNYNPNAQLVVGGMVCASSIQEQNVTVWDTDNYNGGHLEISPQVFPICVGSDGTVTFTDVSLWNCVPPVENDNPNGYKRWTQWIYGTAYTYNNVEVNGSVESYPFSGAVVATTANPAYNPEAPNNTSLPCYGPNTGSVGQYWEITLNNWNYCNPYDQGFAPITTTATIVVVDIPNATINSAGPFCENDNAVNLTAATSGGTWSGPGITNSHTGRFKPWVAGPGTHTITYTVTNSDGCSDTDTETIIVYAIPSINILPGTSAEVCPGNILNIDGNPTPGDAPINSHLWTGDTAPLSATNIQAPFFTTNTQGIYNLKYTVTDNNGCSNNENMSIAVNPVSANIIPHPAEICAGSNLILNGNPSGGTGNYTTHVWTGDVSNLDVTNTQSVTFNSNVIGSYNFNYTVTDDNGCTGNDNITVTVFENPVANAGIDDSICANTITLNATPSVGTGKWTQISGPGTSIFSDTASAVSTVTVDVYGLYSYIWAESFGPSCYDDDTVNIRFTEQPIADAGNDGGICGYTYQLNAIPSSGIGTWSMQSGPGNVSFSDVNSPTSTITADTYGNYNIIWTEDNGYGCVDTDYIIVSFNLVPTPSFTPTNPEGCTPYTVNFNNTSVGGTIYSWDFGTGDTSNLENPTYTFYNNTGADITYDVKFAVNNPGCGDTITKQVIVHPSPTASYNTNAQPSCSPMTATFTNTSIGSNVHIWNWGDNSELDTVDVATHTFINDTTYILNYNVKLIAISPNLCRDTNTQIVTVYPNPSNNFTLSPDSACSPETVYFTASPTGQSYKWDFGNGTTEIGGNTANSIYTYSGNTDTIYHISLITTSYFGCVDTAYNQVAVFPSPTADFAIATNNTCSPVSVEFTNTSVGAVKYLWDFGDGSTDTTTLINISHNYSNVSNNAITYTIVLTAKNENGCSSQKTKTITIYPEIHAYYTADTTGCTPLNTNFNNQSSGATSYFWNFGDNTYSSEINPNHLYENNTAFDKNFIAQLIATSQYGCKDTFEREVVVYPAPTAVFTVTPTNITLPNAQVTIVNNTITGNWTYLWDFGDGTTSDYEQPGSHLYNNYGDYDIWLYVRGSNCSDSVYHSVKVNAPAPIAAYYASNNGCVPLEVTFNNQSQYADTYHWDFGDGNQSNKENPKYTFYDAGTYLVRLTVNGPGGQDTYIGDSIVVYPKAKAFFKVAPSVVFIPDQPIHCYDLSEGDVTLWSWNFGDGETSTKQEPEHFYKEEGTYDISLTVNTEHNCPDEYSIERAVTAESVGEVKIPSAFTPSAGGPTGGEYDPNDYNNDIFHPVLNGVGDDYAFRIFNRWGELIFETFEKNIGWDGYYRGKECKQDVYVWTVEGKYINGISFFKKGDVTLLR